MNPPEDNDIPIEPTLEGIATALRYTRKDVNRLNINLCANYVKKAEFTPVRNLVYGFAGMLLTGVILAIVNHVLTQ